MKKVFQPMQIKCFLLTEEDVITTSNYHTQGDYDENSSFDPLSDSN